MSKKNLTTGTLVTLLCALLLIGAVLLLGPCRFVTRTWQIQSPHVYEEVGKQLAICCQSTDFTQKEVYRGRELARAIYPQVVQKLNPTSVFIAPEWANVEMGGGFYHYGYRMRLDKDNSSEIQSVWELFYYTEKGKKYLFTLTLDREDKLVPLRSK